MRRATALRWSNDRKTRLRHNQLNHSPTTTITNNLSERFSADLTDSAPRQRFWAAWRWWLPPALISLLLILKVVDPFIGDWDGLDYTILALHGSHSSMAL